MPDLRALLGDRYSDAIGMAVGVMIQQVPHPSISFYLYLTREITQVFEVVLPDLLARAWDEGHAAGCADPYKRYNDCGCGPNPYRQEADQ